MIKVERRAVDKKKKKKKKEKMKNKKQEARKKQVENGVDKREGARPRACASILYWAACLLDGSWGRRAQKIGETMGRRY